MNPPFHRRRFLDLNARWLGGLGLAVGLPSATRQGRAAEDKSRNPFAYDVSKHERTDPTLIAYREVRRYRAPRPDARRLAVAASGQIGIATGDSLCFLDPTGALVREINLSAPARCLAFGDDDTLYAGLRDHVEVLNGKGSPVAAWDPPSGKPWITALAVSKNDLFAADSGNRVIYRYDRTGKLLGRIGTKDPARNVPGLVLPSPFLDVEVHPDGLLRVNNPGRHRVETYTAEGDLELAWGKPSLAIQGFCGCCNPIGLATLPDGRIVTAEKGLPRVKVYQVDGTFESVVAGVESFPENARTGAGAGLADGKAGLDVVVHASGHIHILDVITSEILVMAPKTA